MVENSGWEEGSIACDELLSFYKDAARDNPQLVAKNLRLLGLADCVLNQPTQNSGINSTMSEVPRTYLITRTSQVP